MTALERLKACIERHDSYEPVSDDCPIVIDADNCLYELIPEKADERQLRLGDLRDLIKELS